MIKVLIDPGHGGKDRANRGPTGYVEADGVLAISMYLAEELAKTKAFDVKLTRTTDTYLTLTERGKMAAGKDLFISQHTNASKDHKARGTVVYYSVDLPEDREFAAALSKAISDALGIPNRGAATKEYENSGEDYYTVIDTAQDIGCKHVFLVESAFHDNPEDEKLLKDDKNLRKIAQAQAKVICEFFGIGDLDWKDILRLTTTRPDDWVNAIDVAVNAAKADGDLGPLEIFKFLPDLFKKIFYFRQ